MEETIKILEDFIKYFEAEAISTKYRRNISITVDEDDIQALENLLKGYRELEENKELKTTKGFEENIEVSKFGEWVGKNYIDYKFEYENYQRILADCIPKSKIKEKIEEYKQEMKEIRAEQTGLIWNHRLHKLDYAIQVLQELMEDK